MKFKHLLLAFALALVALPGLATALDFSAVTPVIAVADSSHDAPDLVAPAVAAAVYPDYLTAVYQHASQAVEAAPGLCTMPAADEALTLLATLDLHDSYRSEVTADANFGWRR